MSGRTTDGRIALLFDDGPVADLTPAFHAILSRMAVRVSFSYVGLNAERFPELVGAAHAAGHEIINHSYSHPHFSALDAAAIRREVVDTQAVIERLTGVAPRWLWVPYGDHGERVDAGVAAGGIPLFPIDRFHFVSSEDWKPETDAAAIRRRATSAITDRSVILFHEWRAETLAEFPAILEELKRQGWSFVTLSELAAE